MMITKQNKVALITGGARRIGKAIAIALHHSGMNLVIHYNSSAEAAERLQQELHEVRADSVFLVRADLKDKEKTEFLVQQCISRYQRLDALINNASVFYPTPLQSANDQQWQEIFNCNLAAPFFLIQSAAPWLRKNGGCIVNITDIYADRPLPGYSIYNASKAALVSLTRSLAIELGPHVRVNAVAPGAILWPNEIKNISDETRRRRILSRTALKRIGSCDDIAEMVLFLIDKAHYITGQVINIDGGRTIIP